jgi:hypothetical protein
MRREADEALAGAYRAQTRPVGLWTLPAPASSGCALLPLWGCQTMSERIDGLVREAVAREMKLDGIASAIRALKWTR